jgi:hypothetical protein
MILGSLRAFSSGKTATAGVAAPEPLESGEKKGP